jgi:hypothetical protein
MRDVAKGAAIGAGAAVGFGCIGPVLALIALIVLLAVCAAIGGG